MSNDRRSVGRDGSEIPPLLVPLPTFDSFEQSTKAIGLTDGPRRMAAFYSMATAAQVNCWQHLGHELRTRDAQQ